MKLYKSFLLMALAVFAISFASCSDEGKWDAYEADSEVYSFAQAASSLSYSASDVPSEIKINVYRNTTSGSVSLPVTFESNAAGLTAPSTINFTDGSNVAEYVFTLGELEVGAQNKATVTIADTSVSPSGNVSFSLTLVVNYTWSEWGSGVFEDEFMGCVADVKVMKADGASAYRIIEPYKEFLMTEYGYSENEWATFSCPYIEFKVQDDGAVKFNTFIIDTYDGSTANLINGFWPSDLDASLAENDAYSVLIDAQTVQMVPYYYVPDVGGWGLYPVYLTLDQGFSF